VATNHFAANKEDKNGLNKSLNELFYKIYLINLFINEKGEIMESNLDTFKILFPVYKKLSQEKNK
jgi:hypothetical protein